MSGIKGKGLIGPSILAGVGSGLGEAAKLYLQAKHYQVLEDHYKAVEAQNAKLAKYKQIVGEHQSFTNQGGLKGPIPAEAETPAGPGEMEMSPEVMKPGFGESGVSAADLGGSAALAE